MKTFENNNQTTFDFNSVVASSSPETPHLSLHTVMSHIADRIHSKIEATLKQSTIPDNVSLVIKKEDKEMIHIAIETDHDLIATKKTSLLSYIAKIVLRADKKVCFSYNTVEKLFKSVSH